MLVEMLERLLVRKVNSLHLVLLDSKGSHYAPEDSNQRYEEKSQTPSQIVKTREKPEADCSWLFLRQPCISRANNCFRTPGHLQFAENGGDMVAYRLGTEHQVLGNGRVGIALGKQCQDLPLALA